LTQDVCFAVVSLLTAPVIVKRSLAAGAVIERALADGLGRCWPGRGSPHASVQGGYGG
jgi:hypothetical protein